MTYDMPDDSGTRTWRSNDTAFARSERRRQVEFHRSSPALSGAARLHGAYPGIPTRGSRPFLLPLDAAAENLFPGTREWCLRYFADRRVAWHDAIVGGPSKNRRCRPSRFRGVQRVSLMGGRFFAESTIAWTESERYRTK